MKEYSLCHGSAFLIGLSFNGSLFGSTNTHNMANPVLAGLSLRLYCRSQVGGASISTSGIVLGLFYIDILVIQYEPQTYKV